jgi:hypothetical protein
MTRFWEIFVTLHKKLDIYFAYLIAISTTLQASWEDMQTYIPDKLRHWVIGTATVIVVAGHILEAVRRVNARSSDDAEITGKDRP